MSAAEEKLNAQKYEHDKKLEEEKKLSEANAKSHQAELETKQEVITELRNKVTALETRAIEGMPADAQETIQSYINR